MKRTIIVFGAAAIVAVATVPLTITAQSDTANRIDFEQDIAPILATHCTVCHSGPKPAAA